MKISAQTLTLLKNYSSINPSIAVKAGSVLRTMSPQKNILSSATVAEDFPQPFAIYDLSQFLGAVSLFDDPEFDFSDKFVRIYSGAGKSIRYYFADASMVGDAGDKEIKLPSEDVTFNVTANQLAEVQKASSVLGVPEIAVVSDGEGATRLVATETKNKSSNEFSFTVDHNSDVKFRFVFKSENLKMLPGDYKVTVCARGIARFENTKSSLVYFIATEASSEYNK